MDVVLGRARLVEAYTTGAASCNDFVVFNTGLTGTSSQASIIAFNNIYAGCNGGAPTVYWAYNTAGAITTSPALSLDGSQIAFVQNSSGQASLVLLTWKASNGTLTSPVSPASKTAGTYDGCTAPCMTTIPFSGSANDSVSSPFPAYNTGINSSTIYVGDDAGALHHFINIFNASGTPAENTTSPWPITLNSTTKASLASPVYDAVSRRVFVGDDLLNSSSGCEPSATNNFISCGYLYSINSSGSVTKSAQLDANAGILDGPIVVDRISKTDFVMDDLERIRAALQEAARVISSFIPGKIKADQKPLGQGPVTEADRAADRVLREMLLREAEGWLSEESADDLARLEKQRVWVVDPLDGTLEFVAGIPEWCVSIGLVENGRAVAGGICNPATGKTFLGFLEDGVTCNGKPAHASARTMLEGAVVLASRSEVRRGEWEPFRNAPFAVRPTGSVAYKLALVAAGLADATWTLAPKHEWDIAAGVALVQAAGGFVECLDKSAPYLQQSVASFLRSRRWGRGTAGGDSGSY